MPRTDRITACYVRVSTTGQNQAGQKREIKRWLKGNGANPPAVRWYVDTATGDNLDRPEFECMQKHVFNGEIGTVVTWRLDRLSRTIRDGLAVLCEWCDRGLRIVSVSQQIDFNGALGKMLAAVLFGVAEMEQETRRERQAAGIAVAKEKGKYRGRKPGTTKANPRRAKRLREKGLTLNEIASAMGVSRMTICRYLKA